MSHECYVLPFNFDSLCGEYWNEMESEISFIGPGEKCDRKLLLLQVYMCGSSINNFPSIPAFSH